MKNQSTLELLTTITGSEEAAQDCIKKLGEMGIQIDKENDHFTLKETGVKTHHDLTNKILDSIPRKKFEEIEGVLRGGMMAGYNHLMHSAILKAVKLGVEHGSDYKPESISDFQMLGRGRRKTFTGGVKVFELNGKDMHKLFSDEPLFPVEHKDIVDQPSPLKDVVKAVKKFESALGNLNNLNEEISEGEIEGVKIKTAFGFKVNPFAEAKLNITDEAEEMFSPEELKKADEVAVDLSKMGTSELILKYNVSIVFDIQSKKWNAWLPEKEVCSDEALHSAVHEAIVKGTYPE